MTKEEIVKGIDDNKFFLIGYTTGYLDVVTLINNSLQTNPNNFWIKSSVLKDNFYGPGTYHFIPVFHQILEWDELYNWIFKLTPTYNDSLW